MRVMYLHTCENQLSHKRDSAKAERKTDIEFHFGFYSFTLPCHFFSFSFFPPSSLPTMPSDSSRHENGLLVCFLILSALLIFFFQLRLLTLVHLHLPITIL